MTTWSIVQRMLNGHVAVFGDCSGAFHHAPVNPDETESKVWIEPPEAELEHDMWEVVSVLHGPEGAPKAWDTCSEKVLTTDMKLEPSGYDGCLLYRFEAS